MTIDEVFNLVKYRANKAGYNGYISPDDFNLLWSSAEMRFFNQEYKLYAVNQEHSDTLSKTKTDPLPITIDNTGKYVMEDDVIHVESIRYLYNSKQREVTRVEDDRLANNLSSEYEAPTLEFPIYTEYKTYLQFNPIDMGNAILVYLKRPEAAKWAYTLNSNGRPVYDAANSVQPIWSDSDIDTIIYFLLEDVGINMKDNQLQQFAQNEERKGV